MEYLLRVNKTQLEAISAASELLVRLHMGQFPTLTEYLNVPLENISEFRTDLENLKRHFGLTYSSSWGIMNDNQVPEQVRTLWDIHQVIRHRLAYDSRPGLTPENRWSEGAWTVQYDEPYKTSSEPLPTITHDL